MTTSRRSFLFGTLAAGGAAGLATTLPGCAPFIEPAPYVDVRRPEGGKLLVEVNRFPTLADAGGAVTARADGVTPSILVTRLDATTFSALSSRCTHQGCPLGYVRQSGEVECPCHGSRFDVRTGEVSHPPARQRIKRFDNQFDPSSGLLEINLLTGDPDFPPLVGAQVTLSFAQFPQLRTPGGSVIGVPSGLGVPLLVIARADGSYSALDGTCQHLGCTVAFIQANDDIECPCHGSQYAVDGTVTRGPSTRSLNRFAASASASAVVVTTG